MLSGLVGDADSATAFAIELCELCERTGVPITSEVSGVAIGGPFERRDGLDRLDPRPTEKSLPLVAPPWEVVMSATTRAIVATYLGRPQVAKEASAQATRAMTADFSPAFSALGCWMAAIHSDAHSMNVVAQMDGWWRGPASSERRSCRLSSISTCRLSAANSATSGSCRPPRWLRMTATRSVATYDGETTPRLRT